MSPPHEVPNSTLPLPSTDLPYKFRDLVRNRKSLGNEMNESIPNPKILPKRGKEAKANF